MDNTEEKKPKELSEREKFETELAAINILQQVGVSFRIPLNKAEIRTLTAKRPRLYNLLHPRHKKALPSEINVSTQKLPDPNNPAQQIDYYEAEINIRPLYLETIDTLRAIRLALSLKDSELNKHLDSTDPEDTYLLRYSHDVCEALAYATLNSANPPKKLLQQWADFYYSHLTNQRLLKLAGIITMMMDAQSFRASTRLILGLGTTAPREASRVENPPSKV